MDHGPPLVVVLACVFVGRVWPCTRRPPTGARHEVAKRRREELLRDRSLALAVRTGYPEVFHARTPRVSPRPGSSSLSPCVGLGATAAYDSQEKRYSPEDIAAAQLRCQERVRTAREQNHETRRLEREQERVRLARDEHASTAAAQVAARRLQERKDHARRTEEAEIDLLIAQQTSSIEAMNIARMLSPRFAETVAFAPAIPRHSPEEGRIQELLENPRVGTFYQ